MVRARQETISNRSRTMRAVKGRDNASTELRFLKILKAARITGWRRHLNLPGRPDFAWRTERIAVFVDGCFWHGCPKCKKSPRENSGYWQKKISGNVRRDRRVARQLRANGWRVFRVWEHALDQQAVLIRKIGGAVREARS
jgi:DNA mismatch endonuclease (patch repair protein)